ncbi:MAG: hypothetical protein JO145_08625 [Acidobacteriaceae bacterium]|nr:hypothetical protein [Acidobacteriaceae bacterium]
MRAKTPDRRVIMAHEQDCPTFARGDILHLAEALPLELRVADREHLIDDQDFRLEMGGNRKGKTHVHA